MRTKVATIDVYGTMLSTVGEDNPKRKGLDSLLKRLSENGLILCTCSDGDTDDVNSDLEKAKVLHYFNKHFKMPRGKGDFTKQPKDFRPVVDYYKIWPEDLCVIGDRYKRDILPARELGCNTIHVPEYHDVKNNDFDINSIEVP